MLNKLLNWFRRPKWEDAADRTPRWTTIDAGDRVYVVDTANKPPRAVFEGVVPQRRTEPQWRTNFSLTAAQRSERSRKAAATRKANKAKSNGE